MGKKKRVDPQELQDTLKKLEDLFSGEGNLSMRVKILQELRDTKERIIRQKENLEGIVGVSLFIRPDEKYFLQDPIILLKHSVFALDTAISIMKSNIDKEDLASLANSPEDGETGNNS